MTHMNAIGNCFGQRSDEAIPSVWSSNAERTRHSGHASPSVFGGYCRRFSAGLGERQQAMKLGLTINFTS